MTHSPPVPAGNVSPYPLQEAPHAHVAPPPVATDDDEDEAREDHANTLLGVGAAVVLGVGATVAALWFAARKPAPAPVKRGKRKATTGKKRSA